MCWAIISCFEKIFCCKKKKEKQGWGEADAAAERDLYTAKQGTDYEAVKMSNGGTSWEPSHDWEMEHDFEKSSLKRSHCSLNSMLDFATMIIIQNSF